MEGVGFFLCVGFFSDFTVSGYNLGSFYVACYYDDVVYYNTFFFFLVCLVSFFLMLQFDAIYFYGLSTSLVPVCYIISYLFVVSILLLSPTSIFPTQQIFFL